MAKSNAASNNGKTPTKADAIRNYLGERPNAKAKEIIAALAAKGIKVSENHVYLIKSKSKARRRRASRAAAAAAAGRSGISNPAEAVLRVRRLAHDLGGLRNLKQLVDVLLQLG
jgi:hypothetical protein